MIKVRTAILGLAGAAGLALAGAASAAAAPAEDATSVTRSEATRPAVVNRPSLVGQRSGRARPVSSAPSMANRTVRQPAPPRASTARPSADPPGRLTTIYKGTHFAIPNPWRLWLREVSGNATFIENSAYDLKDEDQYDWNKLTGITWTPLMPNYDAAMVVWRYNLSDGRFEVGPFFNDATAFVFPTRDEIISVPVGETFGFFVDYDGITITYDGSTVRKARPEDITPNFLTSAKITGWFGGSEVAPKTVSYYVAM